MRIGIFTDTYFPQKNGVVTAVSTYATELERQGHTVFIFAPKLEGQPKSKQHFYFFNLPFPRLPEHKIVFPLSRQFSGRQVLPLKLDLIHVHTFFGMGAYGLYLSKKYKVPAIFTYHTYFDLYLHYLPGPKWLYRVLAKQFTKWFCNQFPITIAPTAVIQRILHRYGVHDPIQVLPSGFNLQTLKPTESTETIKKRFGIPDGLPLFVSVGRLAEEKNFSLILDALEILHKQKVNFHLLLLGDGPLRIPLQNRCQHYGIAEKVTFGGYVSHQNVINAMAASDLFLFGSKTETQGLVVVEALAQGLPVIAVDALGISDVLAQNGGGILVKDSPSEMAIAILRCLHAPELVKQLISDGQTRVLHYDIETLVHQLVKLYQIAISKTA